MKILVKDYTFDPIAKTITFDAFALIEQEAILLITNSTKDTIIYNPFIEGTSGGTVATNVLTLEYDTSSMASGDDLQIFYWAEKLATRVDEVSSSLTYLGYALPGSLASAAVWQVQRLTTSGTQTYMEFADGNDNYDNIWDNRASLTYN